LVGCACRNKIAIERGVGAVEKIPPARQMGGNDLFGEIRENAIGGVAPKGAPNHVIQRGVGGRDVRWIHLVFVLPDERLGWTSALVGVPGGMRIVSINVRSRRKYIWRKIAETEKQIKQAVGGFVLLRGVVKTKHVVVVECVGEIADARLSSFFPTSNQHPTG